MEVRAEWEKKIDTDLRQYVTDIHKHKTVLCPVLHRNSVKMILKIDTIIGRQNDKGKGENVYQLKNKNKITDKSLSTFQERLELNVRIGITGNT